MLWTALFFLYWITVILIASHFLCCCLRSTGLKLCVQRCSYVCSFRMKICVCESTWTCVILVWNSCVKVLSLWVWRCTCLCGPSLKLRWICEGVYSGFFVCVFQCETLCVKVYVPLFTDVWMFLFLQFQYETLCLKVFLPVFTVPVRNFVCESLCSSFCSSSMKLCVCWKLYLRRCMVWL